jgi:hypothetical protein
VNNEKEIIDQYLKRKVEGASYDMQEAHWQHALKALQDEGDKVGGWAHWYKKIGFGLAVIAISTLSYFGYNYFAHKNNKAIASTNTAVQSEAKSNTPIEPIVAQENNNQNQSNTENNTTTRSEETAPTINNENNASYSSPVKKAVEATNNKPAKKAVAQKKVNANVETVAQTNTTATEDATKAEPSTSDITDTPTAKVEKVESANTEALSRKEKREAMRLAIAEHKAKLMAERYEQQEEKQKAKQAKRKAAQKTTATEQVNADKANMENSSTETITNAATTNTAKATKKAKRKANKQAEVNSPKPATKETLSEDAPATVSISKNNKISPAVTTKENVPYNKSNPRYVEEEDRVVRNVIRPRDTIGNEATSAANNSSSSEAVAQSGGKASDETDSKKEKKQRTYTKAKKGLQVNAALSMAKAPLSSTVANNSFKPMPTIGLGYNMPLTERFQLQGLVAASYMSALRDPYTAIKYQYGFGANHQTFNISQQEVFQIQVPLCLQYQFLPKHYAGVGFGVGFKAGVLSKVKDFNTNYYVNRWGYSQFYNPFSFFGQFNYQYLINSKLALNAQYLPGFTDMTNNAFNRNLIRDNGTRFNLGFNLNFGR